MMINQQIKHIILEESDSVIEKSMNALKTEFLEIIKLKIESGCLIRTMVAITSIINMNDMDWCNLFSHSIKYKGENIIVFLYDKCIEASIDGKYFFNDLYINGQISDEIIKYIVDNSKHKQICDSIFDSVYAKKNFPLMEVIIDHIEPRSMNVEPLIEHKQYLLLSKVIKITKGYSFNNGMITPIMNHIYGNNDMKMLELAINGDCVITKKIFAKICEDKCTELVDLYIKLGKYIQICDMSYEYPRFEKILLDSKFYKISSIIELNDDIIYGVEIERVNGIVLGYIIRRSGLHNPKNAFYDPQILYHALVSLDDSYEHYNTLIQTMDNLIKEPKKILRFRIIYDDIMDIISKYSNMTLWKLDDFFLLSDNNRAKVVTLMLCFKNMSQLLNQIIPKPIIQILLNRILF